MTSFDPKALRSAFSNFMTGVTVVTALDQDGVPVGFTANSFTSVSLDPPLLLVCPGNHLSSFDVFRDCERFVVNILAEGQEDISNVFASSKDDRFSQVEWLGDSTGTPVITNALTSFSCSKHKCVDAGDHLILIGEVVEFDARSGLGLGYCKDGYFSLSKERQAETTAGSKQSISVGAIVEFDDKIFVEEKNGLLFLPQTRLSNDVKARDGMYAYLGDQGLEVQMHQIYSLFHDDKNNERFIFFRAHATSNYPGGQGKFMSLEEACDAQWGSEAESIMVRRFYDESRVNAFGLYVGNVIAGEVHVTDEHPV